MENELRTLLEGWAAAPILIDAADRYEAYSAADAALAASGTVTTEIAICGTPLVTGYRMGWLSAAWARSVITPTICVRLEYHCWAGSDPRIPSTRLPPWRYGGGACALIVCYASAGGAAQRFSASSRGDRRRRRAPCGARRRGDFELVRPRLSRKPLKIPETRDLAIESAARTPLMQGMA